MAINVTHSIHSLTTRDARGRCHVPSTCNTNLHLKSHINGVSIPRAHPSHRPNVQPSRDSSSNTIGRLPSARVTRFRRPSRVTSPTQPVGPPTLGNGLHPPPPLAPPCLFYFPPVRSRFVGQTAKDGEETVGQIGGRWGRGHRFFWPPPDLGRTMGNCG